MCFQKTVPFSISFSFLDIKGKTDNKRSYHFPKLKYLPNHTLTNLRKAIIWENKLKNKNKFLF